MVFISHPDVKPFVAQAILHVTRTPALRFAAETLSSWVWEGGISHAQVALDSVLHRAVSDERRQAFGEGSGSAVCRMSQGGLRANPHSLKDALGLLTNWDHLCTGEGFNQQSQSRAAEGQFIGGGSPIG